LPLLIAKKPCTQTCADIKPQAARHQPSRPHAARPGLAGTIAQPCFSPHTNQVRDSWVPKPDLCCRRWHPAKTPGVLRIASSVLHILPQTTVAPDSGTPAALMIGRKAAQERFSEENFRFPDFYPTSSTSPEMHFSKLSVSLLNNSAETHVTQQAWMNSRNQTTIATQWKHRQPIFLHPTVEPEKFETIMIGVGWLAESVSSLYTTSFPFQ
jgi:hypothetical protein